MKNANKERFIECYKNVASDDILEEAKDNEMLYLIFTMVIRCALTPNELCSIEAEMVKVDADGRAFLVLKKKHMEILLNIVS